MRAPFLFQLSSLVLLLGLAACGETFEATTGSGNAGGGGNGGGSGGAGPGPGGGDPGGAGGTTSTGTAGSGGEAPLCKAAAEDECSLCLADQCEMPYCKCVNSNKCPDIVECFASFGSMPSAVQLQYCWSLDPDSISTFGRVQVCGHEKCGVCDFPAVPPCLACAYDLCAVAVNGCLGSSDCHQFLKCIDGCVEGDDLCYQECTTGYAAGWADYQPLLGCTKEKCAAQCE